MFPEKPVDRPAGVCVLSLTHGVLSLTHGVLSLTHGVLSLTHGVLSLTHGVSIAVLIAASLSYLASF
jgi:hypothetical protein